MDRTAPVVDPFGAWLKATIIAADFTAAEVALHMGVPKSYVKNWCAGWCRPGERFVGKLCDALGLTEEEVRSRLDLPLVRLS